MSYIRAVTHYESTLFIHMKCIRIQLITERELMFAICRRASLISRLSIVCL